MTINYPNGTTTQQQKNQHVYYANRGMGFEEQINQSNLYYLQKGIAVIHKKPTPIQIVKVDYPKRTAAMIKEAYFRQASTTDYNGVYKGYYLDFEAKETRNKTSFPLSNFHEHQISHMEKCLQQQGIVFILVKFSSLNRVFLLKAQEFIHFWKQQHSDSGRKSIPLAFFEKYGYEMPIGFNPTIPYLEIIDQLIAQNNKF
ncbi:Holliday junction resolvase RecU [Carnobacteriaceae bacterium zg-ZUI240]|nr:Holliday junction resolvase RecU [Carnobacteriaceae bacterium zg-ZUI240]